MKIFYYIISTNQKIQRFKTRHKKTYYACLIGLFCIAPIEMLIITGIYKGVKRYA